MYGILSMGVLPSLALKQSNPLKHPREADNSQADGEEEKDIRKAWLSSTLGRFHVCYSNETTVHWWVVPMVVAHGNPLNNQRK